VSSQERSRLVRRTILTHDDKRWLRALPRGRTQDGACPNRRSPERSSGRSRANGVQTPLRLATDRRSRVLEGIPLCRTRKSVSSSGWNHRKMAQGTGHPIPGQRDHRRRRVFTVRLSTNSRSRRQGSSVRLPRFPLPTVAMGCARRRSQLLLGRLRLRLARGRGERASRAKCGCITSRNRMTPNRTVLRSRRSSTVEHHFHS